MPATPAASRRRRTTELPANRARDPGLHAHAGGTDRRAAGCGRAAARARRRLQHPARRDARAAPSWTVRARVRRRPPGFPPPRLGARGRSGRRRGPRGRHRPCGAGLADLDGLGPYVAESDVVALGERERDPGERDAIASTAITVLDLDALRAGGVRRPAVPVLAARRRRRDRQRFAARRRLPCAGRAVLRRAGRAAARLPRTPSACRSRCSIRTSTPDGRRRGR